MWEIVSCRLWDVRWRGKRTELVVRLGDGRKGERFTECYIADFAVSAVCQPFDVL